MINPQETPIKSFTTDNITLKCSSDDKEARFRVTGDVGVVYLENEPTLKMIQLYAKDEQEGNVTCSIGNSVQYTWQYEFEGRIACATLVCAVICMLGIMARLMTFVQLYSTT